MKHDITHALSSLYPNSAWTLIGNDYENLEWDDTNTQIKPELEELMLEVQRLDEEEPFKLIRIKRNQKLKDTDWLIVYYLDVLGEVPEDLREYRQKLRDIPKTSQPKLKPDGSLDETSFKWPDLPNIKYLKL